MAIHIVKTTITCSSCDGHGRIHYKKLGRFISMRCRICQGAGENPIEVQESLGPHLEIGPNTLRVYNADGCLISPETLALARFLDGSDAA